MSYIAGKTEGDYTGRLELPLWENWDILKVYEKGDKVYYEETRSSYVCIKKLEFAGTLVTDITYWQIIASGGEKGEKGDTGTVAFEQLTLEQIASLKGDKGNKGDKGDKGDTGLQGVKGDRGDTGLQGLRGFKGFDGDRGIQGFQGIQGFKGDKGDKGDKGEQGIQGIQGIQGVPGEVSLAQLNTVQLELTAHKEDYATQIGTVANLTTTSKEVVGAINELDAEKANKVQEAWITPTLINGWEQPTNSDILQYMKDEFGTVHLRGAVVFKANDSPIFTLPSGYRSKRHFVIPRKGQKHSLSTESFSLVISGIGGDSGWSGGHCFVMYAKTGDNVYFNDISFKAGV